jgi:argininosuccinate lyase
VTGTGRLHGELGAHTLRVVYGDQTEAERHAELSLMTRVDQAHLVMLAERRLIPVTAAASLLRCIRELTAGDFEQLRSRPAPRGLYLMYESYLIERLGPDIGGVLHSGRSRNDLKATIAWLRLREWLGEFAEQAVRFEAVLLSRARAHARVVMPVYTHFQAAMPVSYGYYLLGVDLAAGREIDALQTAAAGLGTCPLGASAVAGTDLSIDPARTATLLGFTTTTRHALDAVASRDVPLRLLASAAGLTIVASRLATDLQLWSTAEFGFLRFPDRLVGGSSAMPQKRNAFLLEHLKAKSGHVAGAWSAAASMMGSTPFTNSIEVGTEAMTAIWPGLHAAMQSALLGQVVVSGARPDPARMRQRAEDGFTAATALANRLVRAGKPFRAAHHMVGDAVRQAAAAGSTRLADFGPPGWLDGIDTSGLELDALVRAHAYGGGPGAFCAGYGDAVSAWVKRRRLTQEWRRAAVAARADLAAAVRELERAP